ncbi:MAG: hypothetical protein H0V83_14400 [Rubrobacter sp.]|nr:hypothetical protein [Rubrobacter sp.]
MKKTPGPVGAPGWLLANLAAMGFSLMHTIADFGVVFGSSPSRLDAQQSVLTVLIGLMYTWWAWVLVRAVGGSRSGLVGLMAFNVLWVGLNGVTIIYCLPPCGSVPFYGDAIHLGTLILGPLAAYLAYRALGLTPVPSSRLAMAGNVVVMVAFLAGIFAVLAWVAIASQGAF